MSQKIEENRDPIDSLEENLAAKWRAQGKRLIHQCADCDFLMICEDSPEIACCSCDFYSEDEKILRDEIAQNLLKSIQSAIGEAGAGANAKITLQDFEPKAAHSRLGTQVEERSSPITAFPLRKQVLSFREVVSVLENSGEPQQGIIIFLGEDENDIRQMNFGDLKRKDILWMLEIIKSEVLFDEN